MEGVFCTKPTAYSLPRDDDLVLLAQTAALGRTMDLRAAFNLQIEMYVGMMYPHPSVVCIFELARRPCLVIIIAHSTNGNR